MCKIGDLTIARLSPPRLPCYVAFAPHNLFSLKALPGNRSKGQICFTKMPDQRRQCPIQYSLATSAPDPISLGCCLYCEDVINSKLSAISVLAYTVVCVSLNVKPLYRNNLRGVLNMLSVTGLGSRSNLTFAIMGI